MSDSSPKSGMVAELVEAFCQNSISPERMAQLDQLLCTDKDARRYYIRYLHMHSGLRQLLKHKLVGPNSACLDGLLNSPEMESALEAFENRQAPLCPPLDDAHMHQHALLEPGEQGLNVGPLADRPADNVTAGVPDPPSSPPTTASGRWRTAGQRSLQAVRRMPVVSFLAAVGVVGALLVGLAIVAAPRFQQKERPNAAPLAAATSYAARLTKTQNAQWKSERALALGAYLREGQCVELKAGLAEITFKDGAVVVLEGPATLGITSKTETHLARGVLVAHVPSQAIGFAVTAATTKIIDLGTEFGVAVDAEGQVDVHVFEGMVSVEHNQVAGDQDVQPTRRIVMANEAVRVGPGSGTFQAAPKNIARQFVRTVPEKAKQGVTHPLVLKNPSFEQPDIRRHPKFETYGRELDIPVIGWHTSDFPGEGVFGNMGCQGQYVISDNGKKPITPAATDGNQLMWLCLDKNHPKFHEGWVYQSLGIVDQQDVGRRLRLSADVSAKSYCIGPPNGPRDGAAVSVAFATGVAAMQPGQVVGTPGTWPEMLIEHGWKTLTATLTITPEMVGQELFVRLMASDPEPQTLRDPYQWDNVRCVVDP